MRDSEARAGGWLSVLDWTCSCGAAADLLVPVSQDEALHIVPSGVALAMVLVPDDWPGG
jgi:hypothetical protein